MNILVLGSGGREHALVWKLKQSPRVKKIFAIPGNGGICNDAECFPLALTDFPALRSFVEDKGIGLTVVGPEKPLVEGIVNYFRNHRLPIFGPPKEGAMLEGSKIFAKRLLKKYGIPTAQFRDFDHYADARKYLLALPEGPIVVKADGLAAGKGSVVCSSRAEALSALERMMETRVFDEAGRKVVIEEFMTGEEVSLFVITDGRDYRLLLPAQDYKRALDNDLGKNTGGMGSYAPTPFLSKHQLNEAIQRIVEPTLLALEAERILFQGVLYCGLMLTSDGPRVVEFNCRFGDPETQAVLPLLQSDLLELLLAVSENRLGQVKVENASEYAVCVVLASGGYPDAYETGKEILGLENVAPDTLVFHAGTRRNENRLVTAGGRVLNIVSRNANLEVARRQAYADVSKIHFDKMHYRKDIGLKALKYLKGSTES